MSHILVVEQGIRRFYYTSQRPNDDILPPPMIGGKTTGNSILRGLATYATICFVVLQLADVVAEPLGLPVSAIRTVMLIMIGLAPVLVFIFSLKGRRQTVTSSTTDGDNDAQLVFKIGSAEINTAVRQVRFGTKVVEVQPKVFDLIEYLLRARDRVVGKDELFDAIWPNVVVSEASLTQSIKRARDLFRQHGFDGDVIRTVPRKGYQFDYPIVPVADIADVQAVSWPNTLLPTVCVTAVALLIGFFVWNSGSEIQRPHPGGNAANSIVVLPFANLTPDADFAYFSNGLTETLTNSLTSVRGLRIIARGSAFSYRDSEVNYASIGNDLNVAHVVEGTVQRSDNALRITATLIRTVDGYQAWSQIYNRSIEDIFEIQDDISSSIVEHMSEVMTLRLALPAEGGDGNDPANAEAYRWYLRGLELRRNGGASDLSTAENCFREALKFRPAYPEALVALANAIQVRAMFGELPRERTFSEALTLIRDALRIAPEHAEAYLLLGEIQHRHYWEFENAALSYDKALELNPGSASAHSAYGRFLSKAGHFAQSIEEASIALDLDPRSANAASSLAIRLILARRLAEARDTIDEFAGTHPENANLPWLNTNWYIRGGNYSKALESVALEELDYLRLSLSAIALFHMDRRDQALAVLNELIESDPDGSAFQIAEVYAQWSDPDSAFEWLERAFSHGDPGLAELYSSVNLENLYDDLRFADLAARIGLPDYPR